MKKILLIPTTLVATITPIIATTSCNNPEKTKYAFEFTGNHCKINGHDKLNVEIEENTKVEYTVLPDEGYKLSATQNLPDGATLVGNLLTIAKMDKAYTVTISGEPATVPSLVINGLNSSYDGTVGLGDHTGKITVNYLKDGTTTDVTDYATFDITGPLTWNETEKWFSWSDNLNHWDYDCTIKANVIGIMTSETYNVLLSINPREASLICEGLSEGDQFDRPAGVPGSISPIYFKFYPSSTWEILDVTLEADVTGVDVPLVWGATSHSISWGAGSVGLTTINLVATYTDSSGKDYVCTINFAINFY